LPNLTIEWLRYSPFGGLESFDLVPEERWRWKPGRWWR
jgi:hypothetical protein